jgi:glyoxylase-like metal-dependent hydrolase (beta-lactamase superfamily II)
MASKRVFGRMTDSSTVAPAELFARLRDGERLTVLDVRDRDEFEAWHVDGAGVDAVQIPHVKFIAASATGTVADLAADLSDPVVVVCGYGESSAEVAEMLADAGRDAANLAGGMDAWAEYYVAREVPHDSATVLQYQRPSSGCLAYLVVSDGEAAVVDPLRAFADRYVADAESRGATLTYAVDTHVHADHVSGVRVLGDGGATVVLPEGADDRGLAFEPDRRIADGDSLRVGDVSLDAVALPGHTSETTGYALDDLYFVGDTLFLRSVARPDLEAGDGGAPALARRLHATLSDRLGVLPGDTRIAPTHFADPADARDGLYVDSLGTLRESIPALSMDEAAFVDHVVSDVPPRPNNYERIVAVNLGRETADDETAFELELGPNNCAVSA